MIIILICLLKVKIKINVLFRDFDLDYQVEIYLLAKLFTLDKELVKGKDSKNYSKFLKISNLIKIIKFSKIKKFLFQVKVGLIDVMPTIYAVPVLSTVVSMLLAHYQDWIEEANFAIQPVYNELKFDFELKCISEIKLVHIIYIILMMMIGKGENQNGRSSN